MATFSGEPGKAFVGSGGSMGQPTKSSTPRCAYLLVEG
jgi:hypothetical protein